MTEIIALSNQKGGVGKTTTCVNICAALAQVDRRILLVDLDPQGNATVASGVDKNNLEEDGCYGVLLGGADFDKVKIKSEFGFDVLGANDHLAGATVELLDVEDRETQLKNILDGLKEHYDYIFLDCPPSLNILTVNAMAAADSVIIPVQTEYYALEGLSALLDTLEKVRQGINPDLQIKGVVATMYDKRNGLANEVISQLKAHFEDKVYTSQIPRNVRLAEAPGHGMPGIIYDNQSLGAKCYLALAGEILAQETQAKPA